MKLTPFEAAIERVAERILKRNRKDLEAYVTLFYTRAVSQAVEVLEARTSPAKKANKTRKQIAELRACLQRISGAAKATAEGSGGATANVIYGWTFDIDETLAKTTNGGGA